MARHRLTVVLSQAQGKDPRKRALEESIVAALIMESGLDVSVIPHLYDVNAEHTARLFLESVTGDMVFLTWLFPRAAFWVLDRDGIKGKWSESQFKPPVDEDEDEEAKAEEEAAPAKGIGSLNVPDRTITCLDLRDFKNHEPYIIEIRRIAAECKARHDAAAKPIMVELGLNLPGTAKAAANGQANGAVNGSLNGHAAAISDEIKQQAFAPEQLLQAPGRRWYPVIDYSRCTNCLECLDFCLFGVYGVDNFDRIITENQDSCKKGCPACSRVCPEQAIIFPDYKSPAIAGAPVGAIGALKIDLSRLFGGDLKDALAQAVEERDRELMADGRDAVGMGVGIPKRQADKPQQPKDDLDSLMDALDDLNL